MKTRMKQRLLTLLLVLSLALNTNPLMLKADTLQLPVENNAVIETVEIDIPENPTFEDLKLHRNVYDDMAYERWWQGPPEAPEVELPEPEPELNEIYMGEFRVTYYCGCYSCSEGWGNMTATGKIAKEGRTIAVDPRVIPYGTRVSINGHTYIAEDCGGAIKGNDIDIYLEDHSRVYKSGVDYYDVYILRN